MAESSLPSHLSLVTSNSTPGVTPSVSEQLTHSTSPAISAPSPRPTPPSSTSTIPPQCFPSPTSIADLANSANHNSRKPVIATPLQSDHHVSAPVPTSKNHSNLSENPQPTHTLSQSDHVSPSLSSTIPSSDHSSSSPTTISSSPTVTSSMPVVHSRSEHPPLQSSQSSPSNLSPSSTLDPIASRLDHSTTIPDTLPSTHHLDTDDNAHLTSLPPTTPSSTTQSHPVSEMTDPSRRAGATNRATTYPSLHVHLANPNHSIPLEPVTKSQFQATLNEITAEQPSVDQVDPSVLVARLRRLLDNVDALVEQLPLKLTNSLFDALSAPAYLQMLIFLLSDVSARSEQAYKDIRKTYRYPYLVAAILANGNIGIREAFMSSTQLVNHLLSYLDGNVPLIPENSLARDNNVIIINVAQIITSYLETSPEPLLRMFSLRTSFLPSVVKLLHVGAIPRLISLILPERCVDDLAMTDPTDVRFDDTLTTALNVLSRASIFRLLADEFVYSCQSILSLTEVFNSKRNPGKDLAEVLHQPLQLASNVTNIYSTLVSKLVRALRINSDNPACINLNVYANADSAATLAHIVRAAVDLFRETKFVQATPLHSALTLALHVLRTVEIDRERRVPSVAGQPAPLETMALEVQLHPILHDLISLLIDIVRSDAGHVNLRVLILDLLVECTRLPSPDMMMFINSLRFGELAFKMMTVHPRNSSLHTVVCRAVEVALLSTLATVESAKHWLLRTNLLGKIIAQWVGRDGNSKWNDVNQFEDTAFLSAVLHLACCAHHWLAMRETDGGANDAVESVMGVEGMSMVRKFERFWEECLAPIVAEERPLCGPKPRRKSIRPSATIGRSFGVLGATSGSGRLLRRSSGSGGSWAGGINGTGGAHLVRSGSAHRFGFIEPVSSLRSRFDDVFVEGEEEFGDGGSIASLFDVPDGP